MNEETPMPYVDWDYSVITEDGEVDDHPRLRRIQLERIPPGSGWHIEFRGRTLGDELLLAHYHPSDDEDAREWIQAFESGSSPPVPVSIDTYFGPTDEPEDVLDEPDDDPDEPEDDSAHAGSDLVDVGHTIYIGNGCAKKHADEVIITIPPEVFRDAAVSLLLDLKSQYANIEQRIFRLFAAIDSDSYERFLSTVEDIQIFPLLDVNDLIDISQKPTFAHTFLTPEQMNSALSMDSGLVSYQQLYRHLRVQARTLGEWLENADVVEAGRGSLGGSQFTSKQILSKLVPWLQGYKRRTYGANIFLRNLTIAGLIKS